MMDTEQVLQDVLARLDRLEAHTGLQEATEGLSEGQVALEGQVLVCKACGAEEHYLTKQASGAFACSICWSIVEVEWKQADG